MEKKEKNLAIIHLISDRYGRIFRIYLTNVTRLSISFRPSTHSQTRFLNFICKFGQGITGVVSADLKQKTLN